MSFRRQHLPSFLDRIKADSDDCPPWWEYFRVYEYDDGRAEVFDDECERPERFASLGEALEWVSDTANELIVREIMES